MKLKLYLLLSTATLYITTFSYTYAEDISFPKAAEACTGCHGKDGIGLGYEFPNLAGQKKEYLVKQLTAFKLKERKDPTMNVMAGTLSNDDIEVIASYYSSLSILPNTKESVKKSIDTKKK